MLGGGEDARELSAESWSDMAGVEGRLAVGLASMPSCSTALARALMGNVVDFSVTAEAGTLSAAFETGFVVTRIVSGRLAVVFAVSDATVTGVDGPELVICAVAPSGRVSDRAFGSSGDANETVAGTSVFSAGCVKGILGWIRSFDVASTEGLGDGFAPISDLGAFVMTTGSCIFALIDCELVIRSLVDTSVFTSFTVC